MTYSHSLKGVRHFNKPKEGYKMNSTIDKFVKRANTCVREAKISFRHTGNADLDDLMNRCAGAAERIQKLAPRGAEFEEHREIGLEKVWECLLELQEMEMSTSTVWSELKPSEMISIEEAEKELDGKRPTPQHLRLLKAHHEYQARIDRFIGKTDLKSFMREKPRYTGRDR